MLQQGSYVFHIPIPPFIQGFANKYLYTCLKRILIKKSCIGNQWDANGSNNPTQSKVVPGWQNFEIGSHGIGNQWDANDSYNLLQYNELVCLRLHIYYWASLIWVGLCDEVGFSMLQLSIQEAKMSFITFMLFIFSFSLYNHYIFLACFFHYIFLSCLRDKKHSRWSN